MASNNVDISEFDPLSLSDSNVQVPANSELDFQEDHYANSRPPVMHQFEPIHQQLGRLSLAPHNSQAGITAVSASPSPLDFPSNAKLDWLADPDGDNQREAKRHLLRSYLREHQTEFTDYSSLQIQCGTWNVNNQFDESLSLVEWLQPPAGQRPADIYALGFQELDLSTMTYITQRSDREEKWTRLCQRDFPKGPHCYSIVKTVRLFSTFLLVAAKDSIRSQIRNVRFGTQATGLMGFGANKGGTAVRFQLDDTLFTFVNCHLAAGEDKFDSRYNDLRDIQQKLRLFFDGTAGRYELLSHTGDSVGSHVTFCLGDLNFRLAGVTKEDVEQRLFGDRDGPSAAAVQSLLDRHDELIRAKAQSRYIDLFLSYEEAPIRFLPTYKYQLGSQRFDSEKQRVPSWCDRVLYRAEGLRCEPMQYRSLPNYVVSDHKPVVCNFTSQLARINPVRQKGTLKRGVQWLDSLENAVLPQCTLESGHDVFFGQLSFCDTFQASVTLRNTGRVVASWLLMATPNADDSCLRASPVESQVPIGASETIVLDATLGPWQWPQAVRRWAASKPDPAFAPGDVLVIALVGGAHIFIVPHGDIVPSCFGLPLDCLCRLREPVLKTNRESLRTILKSCFDSASWSDSSADLGPIRSPIPIEVTRLIEATGDPDSPLLLPADPADEDASTLSAAQISAIADALSSGGRLPTMRPGAFLHILLLLLQMLPDKHLLPGAGQSELARQLLSRVFAWARRLLKGPNRRHKEALVQRLARALDRPAVAMLPPSSEAIQAVRSALGDAASSQASQQWQQPQQQQQSSPHRDLISL